MKSAEKNQILKWQCYTYNQVKTKNKTIGLWLLNPGQQAEPGRPGNLPLS